MGLNMNCSERTDDTRLAQCLSPCFVEQGELNTYILENIVFICKVFRTC